MAKVLARRLENVLPDIVSLDQTGFVKNRRSFFNVRRLLNIMYTTCQADSECFLSMDAEKAFNRVEWTYLFEALVRFGFGSIFISWIKLLYGSPSAMVLTNHFYSKSFKLHRGTRQCCPLSPLLFALVIEPLAIAIRSCGSIHGITRSCMEHKLSLYADDLLLFVSRVETSIPSILDLLTKFGKISGYKLNLHKSQLLPLNLDDAALAHIRVPFKVATHSLVYLGVSVTKDFSHLKINNFDQLLLKIQQDLAKWSPLLLPMLGRVNVVKMYVLPRYLYLFQCLPVFLSNAYFKKLDSIILTYIWNGKKPRLRTDHLQKSKQDGGNLVSILGY